MTPHFDLVGIIVSDMPSSLAFYRTLGLDIPAELDTEPHAEITLPNGLRIAWDTVEVIRSFDPAFAMPGDGPRGTSVAFRCDGPAEVDAVYADLTSAGHRSHLEPWDAFWGQRYASVLDPDGNPVDLFRVAALMAAPVGGAAYGAAMELDWTSVLESQASWHWEANLRPRWDGLTDEEYLWEPVPDSWSIRPRGEAASPMPMGHHETVMDFARPEPRPVPVTTIAWRINHILVGIFGERNARYFGGPPVSYADYHYPLDAATALERLDEGYTQWIAGVRGLDPEALSQHCREPGFESDSMAGLVLHINRELIHHGAEICLLRDLYLRQ